jgi:HEAT repeat
MSVTWCFLIETGISQLRGNECEAISKKSNSILSFQYDEYMQVMTKNLGPVVDMVLNSFRDPHPRVRWAAINTIGQLSTDLGPVLQQEHHQRVLPALVGAMDDFQNPRVQVNFSWGTMVRGWHMVSMALIEGQACWVHLVLPRLIGH